MKIDYIEANNFRSYEHFKFVLDNKGLTLIKGQNGNIDERRSNGSGKSSFIYALLYALLLRSEKGGKTDFCNGYRHEFDSILRQRRRDTQPSVGKNI